MAMGQNVGIRLREYLAVTKMQWVPALHCSVQIDPYASSHVMKHFGGYFFFLYVCMHVRYYKKIRPKVKGHTDPALETQIAIPLSHALVVFP